MAEFDLAALRPGRFELAAKDTRINMRAPVSLVDAVKRAAQRQGIPYQRFIREALEQAVRKAK